MDELDDITLCNLQKENGYFYPLVIKVLFIYHMLVLMLPLYI